jgi:replicative DNA helicase
LRERNQIEEVGGAGAISELTNKIGSTANLEYHATKVVEAYMSRQTVDLCNSTKTAAQHADIFETIENTQSRLTEIYNGAKASNFAPIGEVLPDAIKRVEEIQQADNGLIGISTGNTELDKIINGFVASRFVVVAARTGMGKTTKMIDWAYSASVLQNKPVALFSLEMGKTEIALKILARHTGQLGDLEQSGIVIEDRPRLKPQAIRSECKRLQSLHGIEAVYIDYLQIMGASNPDARKQDQVTEASEFCKSLAKELKMPVVGFAQLSRQVEQNPTKVPQLKDLKESGAIEENADQVLFLYRPAYYGFTELEDGTPTQELTQQIVAKNRHGRLGTVNETPVKENTSKANKEAPF